MSRITLATLPQATAQQVFEQVARHLLTQKTKAGHMSTDIDEGFVCSYRDSEGRTCAAGCLIGKDEYNPMWEGARWAALSAPVPNSMFEPFAHRITAHASLIVALQQVHDWYQPYDWHFRLTRVAEDYELDANFIQKEFPL